MRYIISGAVLAVIFPCVLQGEIVEEEQKIPVEVKLSSSRNEVEIKLVSPVLLPKGTEIIDYEYNVSCMGLEGDQYEITGASFPHSKKEEGGMDKVDIEWRCGLNDKGTLSSEKQLQVFGSVSYVTSNDVRKMDPPQPLTLKKGEKINWPDFSMEIYAPPAEIGKIGWYSWYEGTYDEDSYLGEKKYFYVPVKITHPGDVKILEIKVHDSNGEELEIRDNSVYLEKKPNNHHVRRSAISFDIKDKREEWVVSVKYTKGRKTTLIPVDAKVKIEQKEKQEKKNG